LTQGTLGTSLFAVVALLLSGCGTMLNLTSEDTRYFETKPEVYGGVHHDVKWAAELRGAGLVALPYVLFIDLPLSAAADTVTLPITLRYAFDKNAGHSAVVPPQEVPIPTGPLQERAAVISEP